MARPKSDDRRDAILSAAMRVVAAQGLGAPTALIAKEAGVSNGSLFTYFDTKAALLNALFVELKAEMATAAGGGVPEGTNVKAGMAHMWNGWLDWATAHPDKRRALAHLGVADEITAASRERGHHAMAGVARLLDVARKNGAMRDAPLALMAGLMGAVADTTVDFMLQDPANADAHKATAFEAVWRMIA